MSRATWRPWTDEEIDTIVTRPAGVTYAEIARQLGRSERGVAQRARREREPSVAPKGQPNDKANDATPIPQQDLADEHRAWQQIDRVMRANPAQNLSWGIG